VGHIQQKIEEGDGEPRPEPRPKRVSEDDLQRQVALLKAQSGAADLDHEHHWLSTSLGIAVPVGLLGLLVHFVGILATVIIVAGIILFFAVVLNSTLIDSI
jgi:Flp pilus assembly protein TadB